MDGHKQLMRATFFNELQHLFTDYLRAEQKPLTGGDPRILKNKTMHLVETYHEFLSEERAETGHESDAVSCGNWGMHHASI